MSARHEPSTPNPPAHPLLSPVRGSRRAGTAVRSAVLLVTAAHAWNVDAGPRTEEAAAVTGVLTLEQIHALCLERHPRLRADSWDREVEAAAVRQAGTAPNPELILESEDFGGTGSLGGFDASQQTLAVEQRFELGGKRRHRVSAARGALDASHLEWEQLERRTLTEATFAFHDVQHAEQQLSFAREFLEMARTALAAEEERREAGRTAEADLQTHRAAEADALIEVESARIELALARDLLAAHWGEPAARFDRVEAPPASLPALPPLEPLLAAVGATPSVQHAGLGVRLREAGLQAERAAAIPDLTVTVGARRYGEGDEHAFVAGLSLPLPIFDRNRGNVEAASARLSKATASLEAARLETASRIRIAHRRAEAARAEAVATRNRLLPAARAGHEHVRTGYELGRSSLFELLAARRALADARLRLVAAETAYRKALAELDALASPARTATTTTTAAAAGDRSSRP